MAMGTTLHIVVAVLESGRVSLATLHIIERTSTTPEGVHLFHL